MRCSGKLLLHHNLFYDADGRMPIIPEQFPQQVWTTAYFARVAAQEEFTIGQ